MNSANGSPAGAGLQLTNVCLRTYNHRIPDQFLNFYALDHIILCCNRHNALLADGFIPFSVLAWDLRGQRRDRISDQGFLDEVASSCFTVRLSALFPTVWTQRAVRTWAAAKLTSAAVTDAYPTSVIVNATSFNNRCEPSSSRGNLSSMVDDYENESSKVYWKRKAGVKGEGTGVVRMGLAFDQPLQVEEVVDRAGQPERPARVKSIHFLRLLQQPLEQRVVEIGNRNHESPTAPALLLLLQSHAHSQPSFLHLHLLLLMHGFSLLPLADFNLRLSASGAPVGAVG
ncbi:hypothetical protein ACLOJK_013815 [Asimina triloba]